MKQNHSGKGDIIYIGEKCVVCCSSSQLVAGDSRGAFLDQGRIILRKCDRGGPLEVEVKVAPSYHMSSLLKGRRDDMIPLVDERKVPVVEVQLLIALLSDRILERFYALGNFIRQRQSVASQVIERLEKVIPAYEQDSLTALALIRDNESTENSYPDILDSEPALFKHFVGQWMSIQVEKGSHMELSAWLNAAQRVITSRENVYDPGSPNKRELSHFSAEHSTVLAAIKRAATVHVGVPNQKMIRDIVAREAGDTVGSKVRNYLDTLGFSWIPGEPDWKRKWLPERRNGWN